MKKLTALLLIVVMLFTSVIASSANGFVKSPTLNDNDPDVIEWENGGASAGSTNKLVITPYKDRDSLVPEKKDLIEEAYESVKGTDSIPSICPEIGQVAEDKGIPGENLKVSDLLDISYFEDDVLKDEGTFKIKLDDKYVNDYVGLMEYYDGEWHLVDATLTSDGYLEFTVTRLGSFAVVINTHPDSPQTGNSFPWVFAAAAVVLAAGAVVCFVASKKAKA